MTPLLRRIDLWKLKVVIVKSTQTSKKNKWGMLMVATQKTQIQVSILLMSHKAVIVDMKREYIREKRNLKTRSTFRNLLRKTTHFSSSVKKGQQKLLILCACQMKMYLDH